MNWSFIIIALIVIAGLFYWFELRPSEIRQECAQENVGYLTTSIYDAQYQACLQQHGLAN